VAAADSPRRSIASAYATTVGLTIANPATILSFVAAFVGLGLAGHDTVTAGALVLGVFTGSATWWVILALAVWTFRKKLGPAAMRRLTSGSAILIGLLGCAAIGASLVA
jgi:threonine/homoserine/homoserine lactone efflux protein